MKQAVVGGLEVDEVVSFLNELVNVLVSSTKASKSPCPFYNGNF